MTRRRMPRYAGFVCVATATAVGSVAIAGALSGHARASHPEAVARARTRPAVPNPTAQKFALLFAGVTNQYAMEHREPAHLSAVHCVTGDPGSYMCSYAVRRPGASAECHLMQARWTPASSSSFTVTLSGRTRACRTLREAIRTMR